MRKQTPDLTGNFQTLGHYWDKKAKALKDFSQSPTTLFYRKREIVLLKSLFPSLSGKKFLTLDLWDEVLNTRILSWVASQGAQITAIDVSGYLVKKAHKLFAQKKISAELKVSDIRNIKFPDNYFDIVYSLGTIEHIPDYDLATKEVFRVLKPGGIAVIGVPNKHDPFLRPLLVWFLEFLGLYPYAPERSFSMAELTKLMQNAGFKILKKTGFVFMPGILRMVDIFFYLHAPLLCKITNLIHKPFAFWETRFEFVRRHGYIIACIAQKPKNG